jgi:hypothetical protein
MYFDASIPHSGLPVTRVLGHGAGIPEKGLASKNKFLASENKTPDLAFVLKSALPLAPRYAQKPCGPIPGGGMTPVIIIAAWVCLSAPLALAIGKLISLGMREDRHDSKEAVVI